MGHCLSAFAPQLSIVPGNFSRVGRQLPIPITRLLPTTSTRGVVRSPWQEHRSRSAYWKPGAIPRPVGGGLAHDPALPHSTYLISMYTGIAPQPPRHSSGPARGEPARPPGSSTLPPLRTCLPAGHRAPPTSSGDAAQHQHTRRCRATVSAHVVLTVRPMVNVNAGVPAYRDVLANVRGPADAPRRRPSERAGARCILATRAVPGAPPAPCRRDTSPRSSRPQHGPGEVRPHPPSSGRHLVIFTRSSCPPPQSPPIALCCTSRVNGAAFCNPSPPPGVNPKC